MNDIPKIPPHLQQKFMNTIRDMDVRFGFIPSPKLKALVAADEHPFIKPLPAQMKADILACGPSECIGALDRYLVQSYVLGTIDERQKFLLDMSDVRVLGSTPIGTQPEIVL